MGIESPVLTDEHGETIKEFYELSSGCICCSVKGTFLTTVERILRLRKEIQLIVVETTGLADPIPLVTSFWLDHALESEVVLDGVVTLVDLSSFLTKLADPQYRELFQRQLVVADRVVLNKADLVTVETVVEVERMIRTINPTAGLFVYRIYSSQRANVDIQAVTDIGGMAKTDLPPGKLRLHLHDVRQTQITVLVFTAEELRAEGPVEGRDVEAFLAEVLWEREGKGYGDIIRGKGIFHLLNSPFISTLQMYPPPSVEETFELYQTNIPWTGPPSTKVMLTGRGLNADSILAAFHRMCVKE